jgi:hypothetical protein
LKQEHKTSLKESNQRLIWTLKHSQKQQLPNKTAIIARSNIKISVHSLDNRTNCWYGLSSEIKALVIEVVCESVVVEDDEVEDSPTLRGIIYML